MVSWLLAQARARSCLSFLVGARISRAARFSAATSQPASKPVSGARKKLACEAGQIRREGQVKVGLVDASQRKASESGSRAGLPDSSSCRRALRLSFKRPKKACERSERKA